MRGSQNAWRVEGEAPQMKGVFSTPVLVDVGLAVLCRGDRKWSKSECSLSYLYNTFLAIVNGAALYLEVTQCVRAVSRMQSKSRLIFKAAIA